MLRLLCARCERERESSVAPDPSPKFVSDCGARRPRARLKMSGRRFLAVSASRGKRWLAALALLLLVMADAAVPAPGDSPTGVACVVCALSGHLASS